MKTDNADSLVKDWLVQLEDKEGHRADRLRRLQQEVGKLEREEVAALEQANRAKAWLGGAGGGCPKCFVIDGVSVDLKPIGINEPLDIIPASADIMKCPRCGLQDTATA